MRIEKILVFLSFCVLLACAKSEPSLADKIEKVIDEKEFNGVVLLSQNDELSLLKAKGFADIENEVALKTSDLFVIGSISKQMTAVLILKEFEKGNIGLQDPISKYLKDLGQPWSNTVTVHHLLTHTHGIVELNQDLAFEVGAQFQYSQLGYELLANILEKVKGQSFQEISTAFFRENGLMNTFHPADTTYRGLVKGYIQNSDSTFTFETTSMSNYVPAGAFISNAADLQLWNKLLYSGSFVSMETLELMKTRYATREHPIFGKVEYGYGLLFKDGEADIQIGALGYAPAFVSASYYYPQINTSVIVLENVARNLEDFQKTFAVHSEIMALTKQAALK
ncbi:serine hydrolase domain-containing protein [Arcticibacterium luteifluviistationis]|uniref:Serine hydrolase n=1 Tax=Arcticibacterium luteifluviistationis TaxID=1784714 RepID=A0A2Z4G9P7_9BACT|nr:serine hydrolase [Arcticibacterium luteifluviistationis]AWV97788.1 serine hydrolase [Arcticibacterium luteifluviistationis]